MAEDIRNGTPLAPPSTGGTLTASHVPGMVPYLPMWERQRQMAVARKRGEIGDRLLLLEHDHVYTNGKSGDRSNLRADRATLARLGAAYHVVDRGGDITYHGPGQLVGYAIVDLQRLGLGVRWYVRALERAIIQTAGHFGVRAAAVPGYTGVWVGDEKLAAIGARVSRGIAYHGFALNVAPELAYFDHIVPCGIPDRGVTSLRQLLKHDVSLADVVTVCGQSVADVFGLDLRWSMPDSLSLDTVGDVTRPAGQVAIQ